MMEEISMARQSKREYRRSIHKRYRQGRRKEKTAMLEEFCKICGYNRKYAIWLLSRSLSRGALRRASTRRSAIYSKASIGVLAKVWEASGYLCSQRLKAAMPQWLSWIKKHFEVSERLEQDLLAISARQMDRRLFPHKRTVKRRLYGTTRPGSLLKHMIPIKTDHWDVTLPGYLEIDLVSHSGASAAGEFLYTLDCVDIATGWVERQAVMGKGQLGIVAALREIEQRLPFPLRGIDSDNGSEFINTHLFNFCQQRPKDRSVLKSSRKTLPQIQALKSTLENTDPFELSHRIDHKLQCLYNLAGTRTAVMREKAPLRQLRPNPDVDPHRSLPRTSPSPWRDWTFSKKLKRQQYEKQRQLRTQPSVRFSHDSTNPSSG